MANVKWSNVRNQTKTLNINFDNTRKKSTKFQGMLGPGPGEYKKMT